MIPAHRTLFLGLILAAGGCVDPPEVLVKQMAVNVEGLESAAKDRRRAELRLHRLEEASHDKNAGVDMTEARRLYASGRSDIDGWIDVLIGRLELQSKVDVSDADYRRGPARSVDGFLAYRSNEVKGLIGAAILIDLFDAIMSRRAENEAAARAILKGKLNEVRWRPAAVVLADKESGQ